MDAEQPKGWTVLVMKLLWFLSSSDLSFFAPLWDTGTGTMKIHFSVICQLPVSLCQTGKLKEGEGFPAPSLFAIPVAASLTIAYYLESSSWFPQQFVSAFNSFSCSQSHPLLPFSEVSGPEGPSSPPQGFEYHCQLHRVLTICLEVRGTTLITYVFYF